MNSPIYEASDTIKKENDTTDKVIHAIRLFIEEHSSSMPEKQEPKSIIESRFTPPEQAFEKGFVSCGAMTNISAAMLRHMGYKVKLVHGESDSSADHAWINVHDDDSNSWTEYDLQTSDERTRPGHIKKQEVDSWDEIKEQILKDHETMHERRSERKLPGGLK